MENKCAQDQKVAVACCACSFPLVLLCHEHAETHSADSHSFHFTLPLSATDLIRSKEVYTNAKPWLTRLHENYDLLRQKCQLLVNSEDQIEAIYQELLKTLSETIKKLSQEFSQKKEAFRTAVEQAISETRSHALEEYVPESVLAQLLWFNTPSQITPLQLFTFQANIRHEQVVSALQIGLTFIPGLQSFDMKQNGSAPTDEIEKLTQQLASQEESHLAQVKALSKLLGDATTQCTVGQNQIQEPVPDYSTAQSRAALAKFGPYSDLDDEPVLVKQDLVLSDGGVYIGQWNCRNEWHGYGQYLWKSGDCYEGQWRNGIITGKGRYIWANGDVYVGDFVQNKKEGFGTMYRVDGDEYSGTWLCGKMHGVGSYTYGEHSQTAGDRYIGEFLDGKRNGLGARFYANGRVYVGSWKCGKLYGKGLMVWPSGEMYYGDWEDDLKAGTGSNLWPNGDLYRGMWKKNKLSGYGELTHPGAVERGTWTENQLGS